MTASSYKKTRGDDAGLSKTLPLEQHFDYQEQIERYRNIVLSVCAALGGLERISIPNPSDHDNDSVVVDSQQNATKLIYRLGEECLDCLKDLKRFIRRDEQSDDKLVLRWLGDWGILERDIVPIFVQSVKYIENKADDLGNSIDEDLVIYYSRVAMMCIELFVFMTWSIDSASPNASLDLETNLALEETKLTFTKILRGYKRVFANRDVMHSLMYMLMKPVNLPPAKRTPKDEMLIRGVLFIFRNVLAIPDPFVSPNAKGYAQIEKPVQDKLIRAMSRECVLDLILTFASSIKEKHMSPFKIVVLELIFHLYNRVSVKYLFPRKFSANKNSTLSSFTSNDSGDISEKKSELEQLLSNASKNRQAHIPAKRHNRFGSTFAVTAEGGGRIIPIFNPKEVVKPFGKFAGDKKKNVRRPRMQNSQSSLTGDGGIGGSGGGLNTLMNKSQSVLEDYRDVDSDVLDILRDIAKTFIINCFNPFFSTLFDDIQVGRFHIRPQDRSMFINVVGYFLDYFCLEWSLQSSNVSTTTGSASKGVDSNKNDRLELGHIIGIFSLQCVPYCLNEINNNLDMKEWTILMGTMHSFKTMLKTVSIMCKSKEPDTNKKDPDNNNNATDDDNDKYRIAGEHIQDNLYYDGEVLNLISRLCRSYKPTNQSFSFLVGLVEMVDTFFKVLEEYAKRKQHMFVRKKVRMGKKSKAKKDENGNENGGDSGDKASQSEDEESQDEKDEEDIQYIERLFEMRTYERAFATEGVVRTYCGLLNTFSNLHESHLQAVYNMLFRVTATCQKYHLMFKRPHLELFYNMLSNDDEQKRQHRGNSGWIKTWDNLIDLVVWILRQYFRTKKALSKETGDDNNESNSASSLMKYRNAKIEALADPSKEKRILHFIKVSSKGKDEKKYAPPPVPNKSQGADGYSSDEYGHNSDSDYDREYDTNYGYADSSDGEIPLPTHLTWTQKLGIEIGILIRNGKKDMIGWLQEEMRRCLRIRAATKSNKKESNNDNNNNDESDIDDALDRPDFTVDPDEDTISKELSQNHNLRKMLELLKFEWQGQDLDESDPKWIIPGLLEDQEIESYIPITERLMTVDLMDEKGRRLSDKKKKGKRTSRANKGTRKPRNSKEKTKFVSDQFVHSSDDDEMDFNSEEAKTFFAKEANLRKMAQKKAAIAGLNLSDEEGAESDNEKDDKLEARPKKFSIIDDSDDDDEDTENHLEQNFANNNGSAEKAATNVAKPHYNGKKRPYEKSPEINFADSDHDEVPNLALISGNDTDNQEAEKVDEAAARSDILKDFAFSSDEDDSQGYVGPSQPDPEIKDPTGFFGFATTSTSSMLKPKSKAAAATPVKRNEQALNDNQNENVENQGQKFKKPRLTVISDEDD
ncbi:Topoisomerase 1-associated factor 1 [Mycoemilia scoparia]|uniref:Topoisomerase 1-associated factor 1 n=1 Tax=Mycoemilia scoparia TaxID=417184 RepID=A0A9W7ZQS2_9FUNG|nr:Topoisomerase 1-associated factor 1 [Mycoemilia scoparia]